MASPPSKKNVLYNKCGLMWNIPKNGRSFSDQALISIMLFAHSGESGPTVGESLASDESLKYATLSKFMLQLLCIPRSNSDSERVCSLVRKNKTDFSASLRADNLFCRKY